MTWVKACDLSYDHPNYAELYAAGYRVVLRYLSRTAGKGLTAAERDAIWSAGLRIRLLYETTATAALGGRTAGRAQATDAEALKKELGAPADFPVIYALDSDFTDTQLAGPVSDFVAGLHDIAGPDSLYGGYDQLNYFIKHGQMTGAALFQTYAWSGGRWLPIDEAPIEQYHNGVSVAGGTVDDCRISSTLRTWGPDMTMTADDAHTLTYTDGLIKPKAEVIAASSDQTNTSWTIHGTLEYLVNHLYDLGAAVKALQAAVAALPTTAAPAAPLDAGQLAAIGKAVLDEQHARDAE